MAANDNYNNLDELYQENLRELFGVIGSFSKANDKAKNVILDGAKLLKDSTGLIDKTMRTIESTMTFSSRTLAESFKDSMSTATKKLEAAAKLERDKNAVNDMVKELEKALDSMEQSAGSQKAAASSYEYQLTQSKLNDLKQHQVRLNNIKSESAYSKQLMKETKAQGLKIITSLADSIISVFTESLKAGYNNLSSTYESTYGDITSMNSYSHKDVDRIINELQSFVKENKLEGVVTVSDYLPEIQNILKGGLTKDLATTVAKYSVLAKESGYSTDFADPAFLKQVKNMADAGQDVEQFMKDIIGSTKAVTESVGDAFGFANGQINTMTASISDLAQVMNMSQDAATNTYRSYAALNGILGSTEFDTSKLYSSINEYAQNGINSQSAEQLLGYRATAQQFQKKIETEGTEGIIKDMFKQLYTTYAGRTDEWISVASSALGSSFSTQDLESLMKKYNSYSEFEEAFNKTLGAANKSDGEKVIDELKNYQTKNESFNNKMENHMTDLVQLSKDSVWNEKIITALLTQISVSSLIKNGGELISWFKKFKGLGGSLPNSMSSNAMHGEQLALDLGPETVGKTTFGQKLKSGANKVASQFFTPDSSGKFMSSGSTLTSLGKATAGAGIATGLIMQGTSAIEAYKNAASNSENNTWQNIGYGTLSFLGASDTLGLSSEDKMAKARSENGSLDWSKIWKTTGAFAAAGAGVGGLAGSAAGGIGAAPGAAIGAAAGAVTGFVTNLTTQVADMHDYNQYIKSDFGQLNKSLEESFKGTKQLASSLSEYNNTLSQLNELNDKKSDYENGKLDLTNQEVALLDLEIKKTERLLELKAQELGSIDDIIDLNEKNANVIKKGKAAMSGLEAAQSVIDSAGYDSNTNFNKLSSSEWSSIKSVLTEDTVRDMVKQGVINDAGSYEKNVMGILQSMTGSKKGRNWFDNVETEQFSRSSAQGGKKSSLYKEMNENVNSAVKEMSNNANTFSQLLTSVTDQYTNQGIQNAVGGFFESKISELIASGLTRSEIVSDLKKAYPSVASMLPNVGSEKLNDYTSWLSEHGKAKDDLKGYYSTGLDYVPYDNYLAMLHKGEQVKTAAEVNLERANFSSDGTNKMATALKDTLVTQTDSIISILNDIYSLMSNSGTSTLGKRHKLNYSLPTGANEA